MRTLRAAKSFLSTVPKPLNCLVLSSGVILLIKIFVTNQIPERFNGAYEVGVAIDGVLISVLASYIFYLVVVHLKERRDQKLISPHINRWAKKLVGDCKSVLRDLGANAQLELDLSTISRDEIQNVMRVADPNGIAPMIIDFREAHWKDYLYDYTMRSKNTISQLYSQSIYLETELLNLIIQIDSCPYFFMVNSVVRWPIRNLNLEFMAGEFYTYCMYCKDIETYLESHS